MHIALTAYCPQPLTQALRIPQRRNRRSVAEVIAQAHQAAKDFLRGHPGAQVVVRVGGRDA